MGAVGGVAGYEVCIEVRWAYGGMCVLVSVYLVCGHVGVGVNLGASLYC